ncbi:MAG: RagB/SusD family nutrient uptake outer membrane protein [Pseudobacter sp.]|uniref:RagB/SusD family nutrient uptake outer membrane protein n=1 Tax=Pseudobacter sp. TaxID=2045420 RepID=UPI003F7E22C2
MRNKILLSGIYAVIGILTLSGCKKMLEIAPPINSVTTPEIFESNKQAEWAIAAIYSKMINGLNENGMSTGQVITDKVFSAGLCTILGGLSADELTVPTNLQNADLFAYNNKLTVVNSSKTAMIWESAYKAIFDCNAAIEGIRASSSILFTDSVRKELTGEALALRAFSYFYLVNFYGDVPLVLSTDFRVTQGLPRSPVVKVYEQIKADLVAARSLLAADYSVGRNERVRVNRWFAEAMLARVYLYTGEYQQAITSASNVIGHTALFSIEQNLNNTFLPNNGETILQLKPAADNSWVQNGVPEGYVLYNVPAAGGAYFRAYELSGQLAAAFEANDQRKTLWTRQVNAAVVAAKYTRAEKQQYYNVIRLSELHLIRAEAIMRSTPGNKTNAIEDLNILRRRAGVNELDDQLTPEQVITAIAHERRVELFLEWGHRWFDLKRTGEAGDVLSAIPNKQPWWGDYQLLYPIPEEEIRENSNLIQNPEYNVR